MLVLTREPGERVVLAGSSTVTVLTVEGGRIRLGIESPPQVRILRHELSARPGRSAPEASAADAEPRSREGG